MTRDTDNTYYNHDVIAAARRGGARFSVTARMDRAVSRAITQIPEDDWVGITYPHAIYDQDENRWVSDAQVAEIGFTAFTSRPKSEHIRARLIVRRVKRLNPKSGPAGQGELFSIWRHHAVFTDSVEAMLAAEATHRDHAIVEQAFSDLKAGPLAHMPSGSFSANGAWTVLAAIAFNLTRATGTLASKFHAKATTATIRAQLITVPGRTPGASCSPPPAGHEPRRPDHPAPAAQRNTPSGRTGQTGNSRMPKQQELPLTVDQSHDQRRSVDPGSGGRVVAHVDPLR